MSNLLKKNKKVLAGIFLSVALLFSFTIKTPLVTANDGVSAVATTESGKEICTNNIDDDNDGLVDGADSDCYTLLAPLPGLKSINTTNGFSSYVTTIFRLAIGIAGVIAVVRIVIYGIQYMASESVAGKGFSKAAIWSILGGLLLLIGSVVLLNTINPDLTDVGLNLQSVKHKLENPPEGEDTLLASQTFGDTTNIPCADGTITIPGDFEGYAGGKKYMIKLCALPNLDSTSEESTLGKKYYINGADGKALVNSSVSGEWYKLVNAAISDGVDIRANSSFRTWEHQNDLCGGTCDGKLIARPGYSGHQMGFAIDFTGTSVKGTSSTSCAGRATDPDNTLWKWLSTHASNFGIKQYSNESWHWDTLQMSNRC